MTKEQIDQLVECQKKYCSQWCFMLAGLGQPSGAVHDCDTCTQYYCWRYLDEYKAMPPSQPAGPRTPVPGAREPLVSPPFTSEPPRALRVIGLLAAVTIILLLVISTISSK